MRREFQARLKEIDPALKLSFNGQHWVILRTQRALRRQGNLSNGAALRAMEDHDVPVLLVTDDDGGYADVGTGVLRQLRDMLNWQNEMSAREYANRRMQHELRKKQEADKWREEAIDDMVSEAVSVIKAQRFDMGRSV